MDSPDETNKNTYLEFCELLKYKGFEDPIHILGNHDYNTGGFLKSATKQKTVIADLSQHAKNSFFRRIEFGFFEV